MRLLRRKWVWFLLAFVAAAAVAWASGVRLFVFPGDSMAPAVLPGDRFVGLIGLWGLRSPHRFDLVIFDVPATSRRAGQRIPWMKRVVGLPGEHLRLSGDKLFLDGSRIDAPFLHIDKQDAPREDIEVTLGAGQYFVLGDNLDHSFDDSRVMGPIDRSLIKGYVAFVWRK